MKVAEHKVVRTFAETDFNVRNDWGISNEDLLIDLGIEFKILEKKGAWIAFNGNLVGQGRDAVRFVLLQKKNRRNESERFVRAKLSSERDVIPVVEPSDLPMIPAGRDEDR